MLNKGAIGIESLFGPKDGIVLVLGLCTEYIIVHSLCGIACSDGCGVHKGLDGIGTRRLYVLLVIRERADKEQVAAYGSLVGISKIAVNDRSAHDSSCRSGKRVYLFRREDVIEHTHDIGVVEGDSYLPLPPVAYMR